MNFEKKPILLLLLATLSILVGTIITMVLPFVWVNTEEDAIATVTPYSPLELEGRDIYIREGCNNCHSQTIRPLPADVKRYGDFSRSGEFAYDRPHLWGSRRMGPDLARIGGKYPDTWHLTHLRDPSVMVPGTNMPAYAFLAENTLDTSATKKKMAVLGFPYTEAQVGELSGKNELEALVAYMQKLGRDTAPKAEKTASSGDDLLNPYAGDDHEALEGKKLYEKNCAQCHAADLSGDIGPALPAGALGDGKLFILIKEGVPKNGMPAYKMLGDKRIWELVTFINSKVR